MKLFIGNLSHEATEAEILALFEEFQPITDFHRPVHRETGLPRRFAFVTLADRDVGQSAIAKLNGLEFAGRRIEVKESERPRTEIRGSDKVSSRGKRVDDRPIGPDGKRIRYKGI